MWAQVLGTEHRACRDVLTERPSWTTDEFCTPRHWVGSGTAILRVTVSGKCLTLQTTPPQGFIGRDPPLNIAGSVTGRSGMDLELCL